MTNVTSWRSHACSPAKPLRNLGEDASIRSATTTAFISEQKGKEMTDNSTLSPAWWPEFEGQFPDFLRDFCGSESRAIAIRQSHPYVVPGLLQTPEYSRAIMHECGGKLDGTGRAAAMRLLRQEALYEPRLADVRVMLAETALRRIVGSEKIMEEQIAWLARLDTRPNVTIRVIPFSSGAYQGMNGALTIHTMPSESSDPVVYLDKLGDSNRVVDHDEVRTLVDMFAALEKRAIPLSETLRSM